MIDDKIEDLKGQGLLVKLEVMDAFPGLDRDDALLTLKQHRISVPCCSSASPKQVDAKEEEEEEGG